MAKGPSIGLDVLIPDLVFEVTNEAETVARMARASSKAVKRSTLGARDAHGRKMPKPKDAGSDQNPSGRALIRTGRLVSNIRDAKKKRRGKKAATKKQPVTYVVKSEGKRPDSENVAAKKKRAREKTKQMRAAAVLGEAFGNLGSGRGVSDAFETKKKGKGIKLTRMRTRTADTNAALAGILSAPPKDKRAKAGNRAIYRVFEASDRYVDLGNNEANTALKYRLRSKGMKKVKGKK